MWKLFSKEHPEEGRNVTIIFSDGIEWDVLWVESVDWSMEIIPVFWKYM